MIMVASSGTCGRFLDDFEVVRVILINFFAQFQQFYKKYLEKKEAPPKKKKIGFIIIYHIYHIYHIYIYINNLKKS